MIRCPVQNGWMNTGNGMGLSLMDAIKYVEVQLKAASDEKKAYLVFSADRIISLASVTHTSTWIYILAQSCETLKPINFLTHYMLGDWYIYHWIRDI